MMNARRKLILSAAVVSVWLFAGASFAGECGWSAENVRIRLEPYSPAESYSGPYPEDGRAVPKKEVPGGVEILGEVLPRTLYNALKRDSKVPFRAVMTDEELLAAIKPEANIRSIEDLAGRAAHNYRFAVDTQYWGFRTGSGDPARFYGQHFTSDGNIKTPPKIIENIPLGAIRRFASEYRGGRGDRRWAVAARDLYLEYYRIQRPPLGRFTYSGESRTWRSLITGSQTRTIIEFYGYVHNSPDWTASDHAEFWKSMLERARFLRYTTVPFEPDLKHRTFGARNWILYQLQGLIAIAAYFPDFIEADDWLAHATEAIGVYADWAVMPDGGSTEYAYAYLVGIGGKLAFCYDIFSRQHLPMPPRFRENTHRFYRSFLKMAHPGGHRMHFGHTDLSVGDRGRGFAGWGSLAFLDPELKHLAGDVSDGYISLGARVLHPDNPEEAAEAYRRLAPEPPSATSHIMPEMGWAFMRSGWEPDATVIAMSYRASQGVGHSQPEMLGLNLWAEGVPLLTRFLGTQRYSDRRSFPDRFLNSPRLANQVIVIGENMQKMTGSLREWHTSPEIDYIHADHRGWAEPSIVSFLPPFFPTPGNTLARRRVLFVKPDWILILDDIEGGGRAELLWQAHIDAELTWRTGLDEAKPQIKDDAALIRLGGVTAQVYNFGTGFRVETHDIPAAKRTICLLVADMSGELPLRFVTLIHIGKEPPEVRKTANGVEFGAHRVSWEPAGASSAERFLSYAGPGISRKFTEAFPGSAEEAIKAEAVNVFAYHGRPDMWPGGVAARVAWEAGERANHSVFYRPAGIDLWQKQYQPTMCRSASVLLPDLMPGTEYEVIAVSELADGRVIRSPLLGGVSPEEFQKY